MRKPYDVTFFALCFPNHIAIPHIQFSWRAATTAGTLCNAH